MTSSIVPYYLSRLDALLINKESDEPSIRQWKARLRQSIVNDYFQDMFLVPSLHLKCAALDPRFADLKLWFPVEQELCESVWAELLVEHEAYTVHLRAKAKNVKETDVVLDDFDRQIAKGTLGKLRAILEGASRQFKVRHFVLVYVFLIIYYLV